MLLSYFALILYFHLGYAHLKDVIAYSHTAKSGKNSNPLVGVPLNPPKTALIWKLVYIAHLARWGEIKNRFRLKIHLAGGVEYLKQFPSSKRLR